MLAIQYIIGQMSANLDQFIGFIQAVQDTKISMERLSEIHLMEDEEKKEKQYINHLPQRRSISLDKVSFAYPDSQNKMALNNISLEIPAAMTTAIIGESGSGKTTILKLLLKYYEKYEGDIMVGDYNLKDINPSFWRRKCGAILQDSCIFNDTITRNIALQVDGYDEARLIEACRLSNIMPFIDGLPSGLDTRLGAGGVGLSQGQKQRILIARLIYKDPEFILLDESTNSLDEINEKAIVESLDRLFRGRTIIVVAHRLNTVKNAHNVIVLQEGSIIEQGPHEELARKNGKYYRLMKDQMIPKV